jgi:hypothetical protein
VEKFTDGAKSGEGGTRGRRQRSSGGLRRWGNSGRRAVKDGGLKNMVGNDDGFPRRTREVTGERRGRRALRRVIYSTILWGKVPLDVVRMCARGRGSNRAAGEMWRPLPSRNSDDERRRRPRLWLWKCDGSTAVSPTGKKRG